jgi:hypothetical protein
MLSGQVECHNRRGVAERCGRQGAGVEVMWHREVTWNTHDRS